MTSAPAGAAHSSAGDLRLPCARFELFLASANKRPNTIKSYLEAVEQLDGFPGGP